MLDFYEGELSEIRSKGSKKEKEEHTSFVLDGCSHPFVCVNIFLPKILYE